MQCFLVFLFLLSSVVATAKPRVLVVGWDGARGDIVDVLVFQEDRLPNLKELMHKGNFSRCKDIDDKECARAHQSPKKNKKSKWMTAPGWASVFTGHEPDIHKVHSNKIEDLIEYSKIAGQFPSFFSQSRKKGLSTAAGGVGSFLSSKNGGGIYWGVLDFECGVDNKKPLVKVDDKQSCNLNHRLSLESKDKQRDVKLSEWLIDQIENKETDLIMGVFDRVDEAGHSVGFGFKDEYMEAMVEADRLLGKLLSSLKKDSNHDEWLVVLTSDHGGHSGLFWGVHGREEGKDEVIPLVIAAYGGIGWNGPVVKNHSNIAGFVLDWLNIKVSN